MSANWGWGVGRAISHILGYFESEFAENVCLSAVGGLLSGEGSCVRHSNCLKNYYFSRLKCTAFHF